MYLQFGVCVILVHIVYASMRKTNFTKFITKCGTCITKPYEEDICHFKDNTWSPDVVGSGIEFLSLSLS